MQGIRHRLAGKGVRVVTIKPGFVDTPMTAAFDKGGILWSEPAKIAPGIVRAMERNSGDVYLPWFWYWIMLAIRHIPERLFLRLNL
jgi:short-subunit dehydrogenase